jgi:carbamoyltransferase
LGISCSNDGTAALLRDGEIIAAAAEERFSRIKLHLGFPRRAIIYCLKQAGIFPNEVDAIVFSFSDYLKAHPFYTNALVSKNGCIDIENELSLGMFSGELLRQISEGSMPFLSFKKFSERNSVLTKQIYIKALNELGFDNPHILAVDHHLAHAASAYYTSGYDKCLIVTADGSGDNYSTTINAGIDGKIKRLYGTPSSDSPGLFYAAITKYLGFEVHRHEGKITGLAAFGDPDIYYGVMKECLQLRGNRFYTPYNVNTTFYGLKLMTRLLRGKFFRQPQMNLAVDFLRQRLKGSKPADVAAAAQKRLEDCMMVYVKEAVETTGLNDVVMGGGVFGNVKLNQRIAQIPGVSSVFIHPDMGDGGTALGAAFLEWAKELSKRGDKFLGKKLDHVYFGPEYSDKEIKDALRKFDLPFTYLENIEHEIARLMANKNIVGRFNGRLEYGPRALGNRSIIAEPTDKNINNWLNKRLRRTEFMPFAPSILDKAAASFYKDYSKGAYAAEFMTITFDVETNAQKMAGAVCHIDNTARPQVVRKEQNPSYYKIIEEFEKLTGLPVIVNTSFNMHEEPIVCTPEDALRAFLEGSVDCLALGNFLVQAKKP